MVGSSLLALPWAFSECGIIVGIIICFITFLIGIYTCFIIISAGKYDLDFADTVYKYFGKWGWRAMIGCQILLLVSATVIYYQYMSQGLFPCV